MNGRESGQARARNAYYVDAHTPQYWPPWRVAPLSCTKTRWSRSSFPFRIRRQRFVHRPRYGPDLRPIAASNSQGGRGFPSVWPRLIAPILRRRGSRSTRNLATQLVERTFAMRVAYSVRCRCSIAVAIAGFSLWVGVVLCLVLL